MKRLWLGVFVMALAVLSSITYAVTPQSSSTNYNVNEVQFGAGSSLNSSSTNYRAQQSLGSTGAGNTSSPNYWAQAGYLTPNVPFLELEVDPANLDLGTLSYVSTSTGTATFRVRAYVNSGYVVIAMSDPPVSENGDVLPAPSSPTASAPGTEQFGINVVQNLTTCGTPAPANFGANPVHQPNSTYATGLAATNYDTCGLFKYAKGDVIAHTSGNGWGRTDYTISYIINIAQLTKAGAYSMTQDLVAVATY
jgi:hypothetical protein